MKYYVYISDSKVEMLLPQIPHEHKRKIASEYKLDLKILSVSRKSEEETAENRITKLQAVCDFIHEYGNVGSVANLNSYVFDIMPMSMTIPSEMDLVYFSGQSENRFVGLGGSPIHLLGGTSYQVGSIPSGREFYRPSTLRGILNFLERAVRTGGEEPEPKDYSYAYDVPLLEKKLKGPKMMVEFLAKRLLDQSTHEGGVILGTPLYVAMADEGT